MCCQKKWRKVGPPRSSNTGIQGVSKYMIIQGEGVPIYMIIKLKGVSIWANKHDNSVTRSPVNTTIIHSVPKNTTIQEQDVLIYYKLD